MPGFLDPNAVSIEAEYTRYLDGDILGKIVLKNFAVNVLQLEERNIRIPISRHGDLGTFKDSCDAGLRVGSRWYSVETKCSRHVQKKTSRLSADPSPRWMFGGLLRSAGGRERSEYELLFAVGIDSPGFEDSLGYWKHLHLLRKKNLQEGRLFDFSVWPHEAAFLSHCGIFIIPRLRIPVNNLDVTIRKIPERPDYEFYAPGHDIGRLREVWRNATQIVNAAAANHDA